MRTPKHIGRMFVGLATLALVLIGTANAVSSQPQRAGSALPAVLDKFLYFPLFFTPSQGNDWLQFNVDPQHSGSTAAETQLTAANVAGLRKLFQVSLPAVADGAPVYLSGVTTTFGVKNVVYVTTKAGHLVALDASTG